MGNLVGNGLLEIFAECGSEQVRIKTQLVAAIPVTVLTSCACMQIKQDIRLREVAPSDPRP